MTFPLPGTAEITAFPMATYWAPKFRRFCVGERSVFGRFPVARRGPDGVREQRRKRSGKKKSQTACKPGSVPVAKREMAIHLGRPLPDASRDLPGRRRGNPPAGKTPTCRPYLVLLPVGFTLPPPLPGARCALTAPFHPYPPSPRLRRAVCFLWHFPWGRPRRPLTGTVSPWSPDFPPLAGFPVARGGHPAVWRGLT